MSNTFLNLVEQQKTQEKKAPPWRKQRVLKKQAIPTQGQLLQRLSELETRQERVLFALAYLTGGRITEIVPVRFLRKNHYKSELVKSKQGIEYYRIQRNENGSPCIASVDRIEKNYPGLLKQDITLEQVRGKEVMIISMENRKNKEFTRKNIPVSLERERAFVDIVWSYVCDLPTAKTQLFEGYSVARAEKIMGKLGLNPHFMRDIRLTHLVTIYDFNSYLLTKFAGWKNPRPADRYIRLGVSDIVDKY